MLKWNESYGQWVVEKMVRRKRLFRRLPGEIGKEREAEARAMAAEILAQFRLAALDNQGAPGYIYAVSNEGFLGLLKIGMTTGTPERRCAELSLMLPYPAKLEFAVTVHRTRAAELAVHSQLAACRVHPKREWFRVSVAEAIEAMVRVASGQAS